jgi:NAD(P) transhydrogenase subunit alpha
MDISTLTFLFIIFALAGVIGYFVVWGVTPALHTPLMAVTNAISGIVIVAAIAVAGPAMVDSSLCYAYACAQPQYVWLYQVVARGLALVAIILCAINIFGGFAITRRMLAMYKSRQPKAEK